MIHTFYKNKKVLVTGDTGFKGSWFVAMLQHLGADVKGYSLGEISKPSHHRILKLDYESVKGDVRDIKKLAKQLDEFKPQIVFHLAAQSLVLESYREPLANFEVNVNGTLNILEVLKTKSYIKAICIVTTDKVYKNPALTKRIFIETDALGSYDPYSASKAAAELVTESYYKSFFAEKGVGVCTARSGNVIGGGDWAADRIVPDLIRAWRTGTPLTLRFPQAVRPWQHVMETLYGYLLLTKQVYNKPAKFSGAWNFGPSKNQFTSVQALCNKAFEHLGDLKVIHNKGKKASEAAYLSLDSTKALKQLAWKNRLSFNENMALTFNWYKSYYLHKQVQTHKQVAHYLTLCKA